MAIEKIRPKLVDETQNYVFNNVTTTGNLVTANANLGNLAVANYLTGTLTTNSQPNITSLGTLSNLAVTGNIVTGNIKTNNLLYANGSPWSIGSTTTVAGSNTQLQFNDSGSFAGSANLTFDKTTNTLSVTNIIANGSSLSSLTGANVTGQVANSTVSGTVYSNAQPNITSVGTLTTLVVTGNITSGNASLGNLVSANYFSGAGNLLSNIQGGNVTGQVSFAAVANSVAGANVVGQVAYAATANAVAGGNVFGAVASATVADTANSVAGANVTGTVANATYAVTSGTAYSVSAANISGTVNLANFATTANAVAGANVSGQVANALVASTVYTNAQPNITSVGTLSSLTVSGNVTLGNIANVRITGGSANYVLRTDGSGNLSWVDSLSSTTPGDVVVDNFTGDGSNASFTLSRTPDAVKYVMVNIDGVFQLRQSYSLSGNVLTFGSAPLTNSLIEVSTTIPGTIITGEPNLSSVSQSITPSSNVTYDLGSPTKRWKDLYLSNNTIFLGDTAVSANSILPINLDIAPEVLAIQVAAPDAGDNTRWLWTWETSTLPYARSAITNAEQISVPLYRQGTYQINNFANEQTGNMTQKHDLYFKWIEGAGTENLISWAVNAGNVSFSNPNINGGANTVVQRTNVSVPATITLPTLVAPDVEYHVSGMNANAFNVSNPHGHGGMHDMEDENDNRTVGPLYEGGTYTFMLHDMNGEKFYLTEDNGATFTPNGFFGEYTTGVTGSRNDGTTGKTTLVFTVPVGAPGTLYYQSSTNPLRRGAIVIKPLQVETNINGNYVVYAQHTGEGHKTPIEIRPIPSLVNQMCVVYDASVGKFVPQDLATYVENTPSFKNKIREVAGTATLIAPNGVAIVPTVLVVEDTTYLPLIGNKEGDIAFDAYTNTIYVWYSNSWNYTKPTSFPGANVTGTVANATFATTAGTANSVAVANVTGIGNIATINKDGNASTVLYGNGVFAPIVAGGARATVAATPPVSATVGTLWYDDTTTGELYVYSGTAWVTTSIQPMTNVNDPVVSGPTQANEVSTQTYTITNYNASFGYVIAVTGGSASRSGNNISWTMPAVTSNTTHYMTTQVVSGGVTSSIDTRTVVVVNLNIDDTAVVVTDFSYNTYNSGWTI
jgi:hypothetical protein